MKKIVSLFSLIFLAHCLLAQIPSTEIYLLEMDGAHSLIGKPKNISNNKGYDSQPCFSKEGRSIIFSSIRNGSQADVYEYQITADQIIQITNTSESEYSPTFIDDGIHFSSVRVEKDSSQRLWMFNFNSLEKPERVLDKAVDSVGYHCWYTQGKLALFILTEPVSLQLAEVGNWETKTVANNVGRCMQKVSREKAFYFVDKTDSTSFYLCKYSNDSIEKLFPALSGSEDFCITPEGDFIMAIGSELYYLNPEIMKWKLISDLSKEGISGITRVAISPDGKSLAVVAKEMQ